jgi:hypothetical protein
MTLMIKSLIILILLLVIAAGAFLSRPKAADFKPFIKQKIEATNGQGNVVKQVLTDVEADQFVQQCTINDRLLWVTVKKDGKTIYTGAFNHWFQSGDGGLSASTTTSSTSAPQKSTSKHKKAPV